MKIMDQAHAPWSHRLKNGALAGNPNLSPRCGAKTRMGTSCCAPAMKNGRCRMHGGASTGPTTPEGRAKSRRARWSHGRYSEEARIEAREVKRLLAEAKACLVRIAGFRSASG
jgi:hypothetical protein